MELYAKGQLSYLILTCLQDRDFYGLDIISEISARSNGKINLKKPSVYSNLTRMEKQGYISSYLQSSDFGPNRKYYSLTDKGRGFYQELKAYFDYNNIDVFRDFVDVDVQTENFLEMDQSQYNNSVNKEKILQITTLSEDSQISQDDENEEQEDFFDFSSLDDSQMTVNKDEIIENEIKENNDNSITDNLEEKNEVQIQEEVHDDARFLTRNIEENLEETFEVKESLQPSYFEAKQDDEQADNVEELQIEEKLDDAVFLSNQNADEYNKRLFDISKDINKIKRKRSFAEDQIAITTTDALVVANEKKKANIEEFKNSLLENKAKYTYPSVTNYETRSSSLNKVINKENENKLTKVEEHKDDAILITGHLSPSDVGKAKKIEPPKIKIVSENTKDTRLPAPKRDTNVDPSHREILNKLYSKTKDNSSSEVRADAIYDYNDLKDFYETQNISFNVYEKAVDKNNHNTNLIYLSVSLVTLLVSLLCSTLLYVIFLKANVLNPNTNFLFILLPALLLLDVALKVYNYKTYTSWMPTQLNPLWKMLCYYFLISCIIVGLNLIFGIATKQFSLFATTLILPLILAIVIIPGRYYLKRILLIKYWH